MSGLEDYKKDEDRFFRGLEKTQAKITVSAGIKQQHLRRVCSQRKEHPLAETRYALYMSF